MSTTVTKLFGKSSFTLTANCSAEFQISNIDVMFILDTTGSMADCPDNSDCDSGPSSKIEGMKNAVRQFYLTLAAAVPSGGTARLRFGFVPYSGTINIKNLVSDGNIPTSWLTSSTRYSTKLARFDTPVYDSTRSSSTVVRVSQAKPSSSACNTWANAATVTTGGPAPATTTTTSYSKDSYSGGICTRKVTRYSTSYSLKGYGLNPSKPFTYKSDLVDTSVLKTLSSDLVVTDIDADATVPVAGLYNMENLAEQSGATGITRTGTTWGGCIEERDTVNSLFTGTTPPTGAYDHDLDSAPTSNATRWHPYIGRLVFDRNQTGQLDTNKNYSSAKEYCVPPALKFTEVDTSAPTIVPAWLNSFLGSLVARGNTYHDIGMMWGARLANPDGIMAANVREGNLDNISRNIIMLTDGLMAPDEDVYHAYGMEDVDNRTTPAGSDKATMKEYHNARFLAACASAKSMGYTIWFIGFGQRLTTEMTTSASSGRAFYAKNTTALETTFRHIASSVADLRLKT